MTTGNQRDFKALAEQAAEAVKDLPEDLRQVAFQRVFDALIGPGALPIESGGGTGSVKQERQGRARGAEQTDRADSVMQAIDRTKHPEIRDARKAIDAALLVLRAARDDAGHDALTSREIERILKKKFIRPFKENALRMALDRAGPYVDRETGRGGIEYRLMQEGEQYLVKRESPADASAVAPARPANSRKTKSPNRAPRDTNDAVEPDAADAEPVRAAKPANRSTGRPGPMAVLQQLLEQGFFDTAKVIGEIGKHITHSRAHTFKATDLSPALVRMLRSGQLTRTQNAEGQYEYRKA